MSFTGDSQFDMLAAEECDDELVLSKEPLEHIPHPTSEDLEQDAQDLELWETVQEKCGDVQESIVAPVYPGARVTLIEAVCHAVRERLENNKRDCAFAGECARMHHTLLPEGNSFPSTMAQVESILQKEEFRQYSRHLCTVCGEVFPDLQQTCQLAHANDVCGNCGKGRRFKHRRGNTGNQRLVPSMEYFDLGLKHIISDMQQDPEFQQATSHPEARSGGFFEGSYARSLDNSLNGKIFSTDGYAWELGYDPGEVFNNVVHSTGFFFIRCLSLAPLHRGSAFNIKPIVIIPGPRQPSSEIVDNIVAHSIAKPFAQLEKKTPAHFLVGVHADSQARPKLSHTLFPSASLACDKCQFQGQHLLGAMRFLGFAKPVAHTIARNGEMHLAGECALEYNDADHRGYGELADKIKSATHLSDSKKDDCYKKIGHSTLPAIVKHLWYFDSNAGFLISTAHATLSNLVKGFIRMIFPKEKGSNWFNASSAHYKLVSARAAFLPSHHDRSRAYKDFIKCMGAYTMEDWLNFAIEDSKYILHGILYEINPCLQEAWTCLQTFVTHHFSNTPRHMSMDQYQTSRVEAHECIKRFGYLMESSCLLQRCTYCLHLCLHLYKQEAEYGPTCDNLEFWVERGVQTMKEITKFRISAFPEKLLLNHYLWWRALVKMEAKYGVKPVCDFMSSPKTCNNAISHVVGHHQLPKFLSKGKSVSLTDVGLSTDLLYDYMNMTTHPKTLLDCVKSNAIAVSEFKDCMLDTGEVVHSMENTRARTRASHQISYISVPTTSIGRGRLHVDKMACLRYAEVLHLVQVDFIWQAKVIYIAKLAILNTHVQLTLEGDSNLYTQNSNISSSVHHKIATLGQIVEKVRLAPLGNTRGCLKDCSVVIVTRKHSAHMKEAKKRNSVA